MAGKAGIVFAMPLLQMRPSQLQAGSRKCDFCVWYWRCLRNEPASVGEETESPIPKSGKDNKRKRASKPEDPQDKRAPTRKLRRKLIHVDVDSAYQLLDDEGNEGEELAPVNRTRKPVEAAKPSIPETLPRDEETPKEDSGKAPELPGDITKFRAELSQCEAKLKKSSDEEKALRLLCSQKEEDLKDLRADLLQQKLEMIAQLRGEVDQVNADCNRWKEDMDQLPADKKAALAQLAQAKKIEELESKLAEAGAEVAEARAEVWRTKAMADKTIVVYLRDVEAIQAELREDYDQEKWSNDLAKFLVSSNDEDSVSGFESGEMRMESPRRRFPKMESPRRRFPKMQPPRMWLLK
uniref:Uncharacterized protein n=1 Tax=Nicotiana tabacum TaxID=4097 RepID=A0A1S4AUS7_TOBAC|nr:PREDICTED: uncharacterized protein LOC107801444 [Nicotiana tabacum]